MRTFEVYLNGKRLCLAGIGDDGVLSAIATWVIRKRRRGDMSLTVGGLISSTDEHVRWTDRKLHVGDEIKICIRETLSADNPTTRCRRDPDQELKAKKKYVRMMAKKLGWKIQAPTSN